MNTTRVDAVKVQVALGVKQHEINATYDDRMAALRARALVECSVFPFRRTPERAEQYMHDDIALLLTHNRIESRRANAQDEINELMKLIRISIDGVIVIDGETADWLFPGGEP